jgi:serine/threonine-protein kinase
MTLSRSPEDQERLIACVRRALARIDEGEAVDLDELCQDDPHLRGPLAEVLGLTDALVGLQQEALREDPLAGLLLADRYQLTESLGRGAMGVVYLADDRELQREVAIKILDARLFRDDAAEQRFQREAESLAALQHRNIVGVHDRGRTPEGIHYLVMERLRGATLAELLGEIATGRPTADAVAACVESPVEPHWPRQVALWGSELARGLAAAHEQRLVHRDVKPSNAFLTRDGRAVLLDFGIASRGSDERLTATQTTLGTPWYMPPEQVASGGMQTAHPTMDVYGLGATLYHLLAGRPPYEGDAATVLASLLRDDPTPLLVARPGLPRDLVAIVERCIERDPARRYPDAAALGRDLEAFLQHQPVAARPLSSFGRRLRRWQRAPARPVAIAAVTLALLVAAIAWPILERQRELERAEQKLALYRTLPSVLAIEGWPDERVLNQLRGEHEAAIAQLDAILALDPADLPVRLWRACLRFDLGERDAALRDLEWIAAQRDSDYFRALVQRYLDSDPEQVGAFAVGIEGLPEPVTPQELYVQGFHELRNRHVKGYAARADALLARASDRYLPARDLRMLSLAGRSERTAGDEQREVLNRLYDESVALEAIYGGETARTQAMRGVALVMMRRYGEAIGPLQRSLELRPERHGPHQNLGIAYRRHGDLASAERHLREAQRLRSFAWNTRFTLAQVLRDRGQLDEAMALCDQLPTEGTRGRLRLDLIGSIHLERAALCSSWEERRGVAEQAAASYRAALAMRATTRGRRQLAIAEALASENRDEAFLSYARAVHESPGAAYDLANLAFLMPQSGLGVDQTAWLAIILRRLALQEAGDNAALRERLLAEIEVGLETFR